MKKKAILFSVFLALMMLFTGMYPILGVTQRQAQAVTTNSNTTYSSLYYFHDYYPTINPNRMFDAYGSWIDDNITYDRQKNLTAQEFAFLVNTNYFMRINQGTLVIIDIKTFLPSSSVLKNLFMFLEDHECEVIFITTYAEEDFSDDCLEYVRHTFFEVQHGELENFFDQSFYILNTIISVTDTVYVLDGIAVPYAATGGNMQLVYQNYPFLRLFLAELLQRLYEIEDDELESQYNSYNACMQAIYDYNQEENEKVKLLVHVSGDEYVDLVYRYENSSWTEVSYYTSYADMLYDSINDNSYSNICAFGFWEYDFNLLQFLSDTKDDLGNSFPIFSYVVDRFISTPGGIPMFTNLSMYEGVLPDEITQVMTLIYDLLGID